MNIWGDITNWARDAWHAITGAAKDAATAGDKLWHFATSVANSVDWVVSHPLLALAQGARLLFAFDLMGWRELERTLDRIGTWVWMVLVAPTAAQLRRMIAQLRAWTAARLRALQAWTWLQIVLARRAAARLVAIERQQRIRAFQLAEAYTRQLTRALHSTIEREAASGYRVSARARVSLVARLLDTIAGRDPALRALTGRAVTIILDLAGAEDPAARLLGGYLIRELITKLGVDQPLAELVRQLAGPLLGDPRPRDLHGVVMDISARLGALEALQATFQEDGGPQVLQAGKSWRDLTSLGVDAALLAFAAAAVAEPAATAQGVSALIRPVGTSTISAVARILAGR